MNTEQERAEFEAWANTQADKWLIVGGLTWSPGTNDYASARTNAAWAAWQAGRAALQSQDAEDALIAAMQEAVDLLGPHAPSCCGCEYEWNHALRVLREAIDHARRIEGDE